MSMRKRKNSFQKTGTNKIRLIANVLKHGYNAYNTYRQLKPAKSVTTPVLTDQRDVITTYSKRRMPRRKKRRYVRSLRRWKSAQLRTSPSRIFQYVNVNSITWAANTSRYFGAFSGLMGQNFYDNNFGETWNSITSTGAGGAETKADASQFRLDHQALRIVLRNTTTVGSANATPTVDVDVYKVICIKDIPLDLWVSANGIESMLVAEKNRLRQAQGMDIEVGTTGTGIATAQQNAGTSSANQVVGDSLWNNPPFLKYFKIIKQFKVQLGSNNICEFSWRDSKNRTVSRADCFGTSALAARKGITRGFIFNVNGRAFDNSGTIEFASGSMVLEQYVRYNCKVIGGTSPTLVYDGN